MLEWNVFVENVNSGQIETFNIFRHGKFPEDCKDALLLFEKECGEQGDVWRSYDNLVTNIENSLRYWFGNKCEYEVLVSGWPPGGKTKEKKIDVYQQIKINLYKFVNYIIKNKDVLCNEE